MYKIIICLLSLTASISTMAEIKTNKTVYLPGETIQITTSSTGIVLVLKDISTKGEPTIATLKSAPYCWKTDTTKRTYAIGIYEQKGKNLNYLTYIRIAKKGLLTSYKIEKQYYKGLSIYTLDGGMSAEYAVEKSLSNLTAGVSHTWKIGPGGGPNPVWGAPDFLEKSLDTTVDLYNSNLGASTPIETVIISTGVPSIPYLSAAMKAPVLPLHFLVSVNSIKEIKSILSHSSQEGTPCYATLGYDASMSDVSVAWIKLLNLPSQYKKFITDHNVKNVIIAGVGEASKGESFCRKVKSTKDEYSNGSIYILYTHGGSDFDIKSISSSLIDYNETDLEKGSFLADWECGVVNKQIERFKYSINIKTKAIPYSLIAPHNMIVMYDLANYIALWNIQKNSRNKTTSIGGIYLNEYIISQPMFEYIQKSIPLLYWQFNTVKSTVDRVDALQKLTQRLFLSANLKNTNISVNARIGKKELVSELKNRGYKNITYRLDNVEEVWDLKDGVNAPCEFIAEKIIQTIGVEMYKKINKEIKPLGIKELSECTTNIKGLDFK